MGFYKNQIERYIFCTIYICIPESLNTNISHQLFDYTIPITFNTRLKVRFSNKKYTITTQTRPTQIEKVYFLLKPVFNEFLKNIDVQI